MLESLQSHFENDRLHVVAPPGAGKTVLGIEVVLKLGAPALVFAPTLAIRDQWEQRLREDFVAGDADWISRDLNNPGLFTLTTYQQLFASIKKDGEASIFANLQSAGIGTLVFDEAHHLRREWWRCLTLLCQTFTQCRRVSLTATPPYDVDVSEWTRYTELCGEVDVEIPIPELVANGDLCPHADFVYFQPADSDLRIAVNAFHDQTEKWVDSLPQRPDLVEIVQALPIVQDSIGNEESIFDDPGFFTSCLCFLKAAGCALPEGGLELFEAKEDEVPCFSRFWANTLLKGLFKLEEASDSEDLRMFKSELRQIEALASGKPSLLHCPRLDRNLLRSAGRLEAIGKIIATEEEHLGEDLRLVVLTDYIRGEALGAEDSTLRFGAAPLFRTLLERNFKGVALLTGSVVIVPNEAIAAASLKEGEAGISFRPFRQRPTHQYLEIAPSAPFSAVSLLTRLFHEGHIKVLVGTQSLLGEGWDAPCINSLIIASNGGSFMLSNQVRGRAIRTLRSDPNKTANIWHLVTLVGHPEDEPDFEILRRRFNTFVGPALLKEGIQSGVDRLGLKNPPTLEAAEKLNALQLDRARDSEWIRKKWGERIGGIQHPELRRTLELPKSRTPRGTWFFRSIEAGLFLVACGFLFTFLEVLFVRARDPQTAGYAVIIATGVGLIRYGHSLFRGFGSCSATGIAFLS